MPKLDEIDKIKDLINELDNEAQYAMETGNVMEDVEEPDIDEQFFPIMERPESKAGEETKEASEGSNASSAIEEADELEFDIPFDILAEEDEDYNPFEELKKPENNPEYKDEAEAASRESTNPQELGAAPADAFSTLDKLDELEELQELEELGEPEATSDAAFSAPDELGGQEEAELAPKDAFSELDELGGQEEAELAPKDAFSAPDELGGQEEAELAPKDAFSELDELGGQEEAELAPKDAFSELDELGGQEEAELAPKDAFSELDGAEHELLEDFIEDEEDLEESVDTNSDETSEAAELLKALKDQLNEQQFIEGLEFFDSNDVSTSYDEDNVLSFEIERRELEAFQNALSYYPLNLKIAIQDEIGQEDGLQQYDIETIIQMIISGSTPKKVAEFFFRHTGKKISIPASGWRSSGYVLEEKKKKFPYIFRIEALPKLRLASGILTLVFISYIALFTFVYRPIQTNYFYRKGYEAILEDQNNSAEYYFNRARIGWNLGPIFVKGLDRNKWYLRYADGYQERRQYFEAASKYNDAIEYFPDNRENYYEYARMLNKTYQFNDALDILQKCNNYLGWDYTLSMLSGDAYFGLHSDNINMYFEALNNYSASGGSDEAMLKILRTYLAIAKNQDTDEIKARIGQISSIFMGYEELGALNRLGADVLAELAEYFINNNRMADSRSVLLKALSFDPTAAKVYIEFANYYRKLQNSDAEEKGALERALFFMDNTGDIQGSISNYLKAYSRLGEVSFKNGDRRLAFDYYQSSLALIKSGEERYIKLSNELVGSLYKNIGDYFYDQEINDLKMANIFYGMAKDLNINHINLDYRMGFFNYQNEDYKTAVKLFSRALEQAPNDKKIQFALATSLLRSNYYMTAEGLYRQLQNNLNKDISNILILDPQRIPEVRDMLISNMMVSNNLGVSFYRYAKNNSDDERLELALSSFNEALVMADILNRDLDTGLKLTREYLFQREKLSPQNLENLEEQKIFTDFVADSLPKQNMDAALQSAEYDEFKIFEIDYRDYEIAFLDTEFQ